MRTLLDSLQAHGELVPGKNGYSEGVRAELLAMSASTIDRYLRPARTSVRGCQIVCVNGWFSKEMRVNTQMGVRIVFWTVLDYRLVVVSVLFYGYSAEG